MDKINTVSLWNYVQCTTKCFIVLIYLRSDSTALLRFPSLCLPAFLRVIACPTRVNAVSSAKRLSVVIIVCSLWIDRLYRTRPQQTAAVPRATQNDKPKQEAQLSLSQADRDAYVW